MRARDILKDRVTLVLERNRYRNALRKIVEMQHYIGTEERSAPELDDAVHVAEAALAARRKNRSAT